jgi:hypothetical protein
MNGAPGRCRGAHITATGRSQHVLCYGLSQQPLVRGFPLGRATFVLRQKHIPEHGVGAKNVVRPCIGERSNCTKNIVSSASYNLQNKNITRTQPDNDLKLYRIPRCRDSTSGLQIRLESLSAPVSIQTGRQDMIEFSTHVSWYRSHDISSASSIHAFGRVKLTHALGRVVLAQPRECVLS